MSLACLRATVARQLSFDLCVKVSGGAGSPSHVAPDRRDPQHALKLNSKLDLRGLFDTIKNQGMDYKNRNIFASNVVFLLIFLKII